MNFMEKKIIFSAAHNLIKAKISGEEKYFRYPISLSHRALMFYNPKWDIELILLFEKLLVMYNWNKCEPIFYQGHRLEKDLHIGRGRIEKAREELRNMGILTEKPGKGNIKMYSLDRDKIIELLPEIYKMPDDPAEKQTLLQELKSFFNFYLTKGGGAGRFQITGKIRNDQGTDEDYSIDIIITES